MAGNLERPQAGILSRKALPSRGKTVMYPVSSAASGFLLCSGKEPGGPLLEAGCHSNPNSSAP